jgi:hypothetical protein
MHTAARGAEGHTSTAAALNTGDGIEKEFAMQYKNLHAIHTNESTHTGHMHKGRESLTFKRSER